MVGPWPGGARGSSRDGAASVLVAGDDRVRVEVLALTLTNAGYVVVAAHSVARAAAHIAERMDVHPIDLVVLDGTDRPWVAGAVVMALRAAGCELPILLVLGDEPIMRAELGKRHAQIVDAPITADEVSAMAGELLSTQEDAEETSGSQSRLVDAFGSRVPVG